MTKSIDYSCWGKSELIDHINKLENKLMQLNKIKYNTIDLSAVSTQELLKRLEFSDGVNDTYKMIVIELQKRGIKAEVPKTE